VDLLRQSAAAGAAAVAPRAPDAFTPL